MVRNFDFVDLVVFVDFAVFAALAIFAESVVWGKSMDSVLFVDRLILTIASLYSHGSFYCEAYCHT